MYGKGEILKGTLSIINLKGIDITLETEQNSNVQILVISDKKSTIKIL